MFDAHLHSLKQASDHNQIPISKLNQQTSSYQAKLALNKEDSVRILTKSQVLTKFIFRIHETKKHCSRKMTYAKTRTSYKETSSSTRGESKGKDREPTGCSLQKLATAVKLRQALLHVEPRDYLLCKPSHSSLFSIIEAKS